MLFREMGRERAREARPLEDAPEPRTLPPDLGDDTDARIQCLRRCLAQLSPENRDLILHYYQGDKSEKINNRKGLTRLFGIPSNTLRMRALRVREKLQLLVENCLRRLEGNLV